MKRVHGGTFYTWHLHTWKKTESDPRERSILCIHRAYISFSLESRKPESKSPRACEFGARGERAIPLGRNPFPLPSLPFPFSCLFLPMPCDRFGWNGYVSVAPHKRTRGFLSLSLFLTLSSFRIRARSLITALRKVAETLSSTSLPNRPEMRGNAEHNILKKKCFLSLQEPHATRCDVYVYIREIFILRIGYAFLSITPVLHLYR